MRALYSKQTIMPRWRFNAPLWAKPQSLKQHSSQVSAQGRCAEISHSAKFSQLAGFTLVETMVVVAVMGILAALAIASGFDRDKLVVENSRKTVMRAFREAQRQALILGAPVAVSIFPNRVEVFIWNDINRDRIVNWVDANANGVFDAGEGEVSVSFGGTRYVIGRLEGILSSTASNDVVLVSPTAADINTPDTALNFLCNQGALAMPGVDALAARFLPNGIFYGADETLCNARIYILHNNGRLALVNIDAGGQIRTSDSF